MSKIVATKIEGQKGLTIFSFRPLAGSTMRLLGIELSSTRRVEIGVESVRVGGGACLLAGHPESLTIDGTLSPPLLAQPVVTGPNEIVAIFHGPDARDLDVMFDFS